MNDVKRRQLVEANQCLQQASIAVSGVMNSERVCYATLPAGMQHSRRGEAMEDSIEYMGDAMVAIKDAVSALNSACAK